MARLVSTADATPIEQQLDQFPLGAHTLSLKLDYQISQIGHWWRAHRGGGAAGGQRVPGQCGHRRRCRFAASQRRVHGRGQRYRLDLAGGPTSYFIRYLPDAPINTFVSRLARSGSVITATATKLSLTARRQDFLDSIPTTLTGQNRVYHPSSTLTTCGRSATMPMHGGRRSQP